MYAYRYSLTLSCWEIKPDKRPSFLALVNTISMSLQEISDYMQVNAFTEDPNSTTEETEEDCPEH